MNAESLLQEMPAIDDPRFARMRCVFIAPRFAHDPEWAWLTRCHAMRPFAFESFRIETKWNPLPAATGLYLRWQYARAARAAATARVVFLFSPEIVQAMTARLAKPALETREQGRDEGPIRGPRRSTSGWSGRRRPVLVHVGFHQDGPWLHRRAAGVARALQRCDAITVFTVAERQVLAARFGIDESRMRIVPIHTDEPDGYVGLAGPSPPAAPYALALGSANRRFEPAARACRELGVPLVVLTRSTHAADSLEVLRDLGATVMLDADRRTALKWLRHAHLAVLPFRDPQYAAGFITIVHAMFLGTPVVATECLGMREMVLDGQTGLVAPHGDDEALRAAVERAWHDQPLACGLARAASRRAAEVHSPDAAAQRFAQLIDELTDGRGGWLRRR
jgi:hypothetical protein